MAKRGAKTVKQRPEKVKVRRKPKAVVVVESAMEAKAQPDLWNRQESGRFGKGNKGGPGNNNKEEVLRLKKAIYEATTENDLKQVWAALTRKAKAGNNRSIETWLAYLVGRPKIEMDIKAEGNSEINIRALLFQQTVDILAEGKEANARIASLMQQVKDDKANAD